MEYLLWLFQNEIQKLIQANKILQAEKKEFKKLILKEVG